MTNEKFLITRISEEQIPLAGVVLEQAFSADPINVYTCPDPAERTRVFTWLFTAMVRASAYMQGAYVTAGDLKGVAVWLPLLSSERTAEQSRKSELDQMSDHFGPVAYERFTRVYSSFLPLHKETIQGPHWYLAQLGVAPQHQGQGIGGALLAPALQWADKKGIVCYLETFVPRTVPFYQRYGFQVAGTAVDPQSQISCWIMKREPCHR